MSVGLILLAVADLAPRRARGEARLARAGLLSRPSRRARRARVRNVQVPLDVCRRERAPGRPRRTNEASGPLFKIKDDPRVTRVGRIHAALLDRRAAPGAERPARRDVARRPPSVAAARLRAARGLAPEALPRAAGHDRASGRSPGASTCRFDDLVRLDFYYLENWSIWLDISILAKTLPAVLARRGAY